MRSIPAAMTWEILKRGRWQLVFAMLVSIAFPALLLVALGHDGLVDAKDPSMLIMQIVLMQVGIFSFATALYGAQGKMSRLYAYPARTLYGMASSTYYPMSVAFSPTGTALAVGEVTCGKVMLCAD